MEANRQDLMTSVGLLVLRVGIGAAMSSHGWGKLQMLLNGQAQMMGDPIGLGPTLSLILVTFAEFFCALFVMIGFFTRLSAIPLVIAMGVAAFVAHGSDPWSMEAAFKLFMAGQSKFPVSKEPALMFLVPYLALVFTGAGRFSVDGILWPRFKAWRESRKKS